MSAVVVSVSKFLAIQLFTFKQQNVNTLFADMCPKPNETRSEISKKSHVEDLDGIPGLFKALTDDPDEENKWSMYTFPVDFDTAHYGAKLDTDLKFYLR